MQKITVNAYRSQSELTRAHPEVKTFKLVHHAPRGQHTEAQIAALKAKNIEGQVYQVGDFFYKAEALSTLCACFHYIGDNPNCRHHPRAT